MKKYASDSSRRFDLILVEDYAKADRDLLEKQFQIDPLLLEYVDDKNGPARIESDDSLEDTVIVFWVPISERSHSEPISVIFHKQQMFVFLNSKMIFIHDTIMDLLEQSEGDRVNFLLDLLQLTLNKYLDIISNLFERTEHIQTHLSSHRNSRNFENLTRVNRSVVFLRSAVKENADCFSQIHAFFKDAHVEVQTTAARKLRKLNLAVRQSTRLIDLISENVEQLSDAYDRLINNDLNAIMRFLTVWSLLLAIPPIVSGFYGMNMHLPLAAGSLAWLISLIVTVILMVALIIYLHHHHSL
ncbi:magnesium transporter CorA family protein [Oenococcus kitaharae]|uniref:magnesium transporter CorA family protein n=1 Tax=Oenococcus kitaharae TaxID=336988 RepID=UPI00138AEA36|nr:magnesium transporter CorA family protein [Oenococcus kitaharae]